MKKILLNIILLCTLLIVLKWLFTMLMPTTFKDDIAESKWNILQQKPETNLLFTGTSRIWNGIWPPTIDSINSSGLRSFNFGLPLSTLPYTADILLNGLRNRPHQVKYVVIEIAAPHLESHNLIRGIEFHLQSNPVGTGDVLQALWADARYSFHEFIGFKPEVLAITKRLPLAKKSALINTPQSDSNGFSLIPPKFKPNAQAIRNLTVSTSGAYYDAHHPDADFPIGSNLQRVVDEFKKEGIDVIYILPKIIDKRSVKYVVESFRGLKPEQRLMIDTAAHFDIIENPAFRRDNYHFNIDGAKSYSVVVGKALKNHLDTYFESP